MRPILAIAIVAAFVSGACAPRPRVLTAPANPRFPEFPYPEVSPDLQSAAAQAATAHQQAWYRLQYGDLRAADRAFTNVLKRTPTFYPAAAGLGYVALARKDYEEALEHFGRALEHRPDYAPALVGKGEALLATKGATEALAAFEAAVRADPTLVDIARRVDVLRFRGVQESVLAAQQAAQAGQLEEARRQYLRALEASPESGFLYRDLAAVEGKLGHLDAAKDRALKAVALDPTDASAHVVLADVLEKRQEYEAAADALATARNLDPALGLNERITALRRQDLLTRLPPEYAAIGTAPRVTRGALAALLGVQLEPLMVGAQRRDAVLITDSRGHWAFPWIMTVARAGVMEVYSNHTFQPEATVRRIDLALAVSRTLNLIAARDRSLARTWQSAREKFGDLGPGHLQYPAASLAVASGVMSVGEDRAFRASQPATGAEALQAVERLAALARKAGVS